MSNVQNALENFYRAVREAGKLDSSKADEFESYVDWLIAAKDSAESVFDTIRSGNDVLDASKVRLSISAAYYATEE